MITKLKKRLTAILLSLFSCALSAQNCTVNADPNTKRLLREMYRARLEYPSNSISSRKLQKLIKLLEDTKATSWDENADWALNLKVEMSFDDDPEWHGGKLCEPTQCKTVRKPLPTYIIADFGKSLSGNTWRLKKTESKMVLEKIKFKSVH